MERSRRQNPQRGRPRPRARREDQISLLAEGDEGEHFGRTHSTAAESVHDALCCLPIGWFSCCSSSSNRIFTDYENFLSQVKTGDIFLFEGTGGFSWWIQCTTTVKYSHIAVVVKLVDPANPGKPHFMLWESSGKDGMYDFVTKGSKDGLRLVSMHQKLYEYGMNDYSVSYRPMTVYDKTSLDYIAEGRTNMKAWELILRGAHIPYETDYVELLNSYKRWVVGERGHLGEHNRESVFCSEGVMWFYRDAMGLSLEDAENGITWVPEDFTPEDFAQESEGIPFAYSDPPRASFGGQYTLVTKNTIGKALRRRYREFMRNKDSISADFTAMLRAGVSSVKEDAHGATVIYLHGDKLWKIDFGQNAFPVHDDQGMTRETLDRYI